MQVWEQDFRPRERTFTPRTVVPMCRGMAVQQCRVGYFGERGDGE